MTLLFYKRSQGKGEVYQIRDNHGNIDLLKNYPGWRKSWTHIVYSFTPSLFFYDSSSGAAECYNLDEDGTMHLVSSTTYSKGWTHIVQVGVLPDSGLALLLFYNVMSGDAKFYFTNPAGDLEQRAHTTLSRGWTHIITNAYTPGNSTVTGLPEGNYPVLFYNATSGLAQFYQYDMLGNMHQISNTTVSKGWTHIALNFAPGMRPFNLLVYNANSGDTRGYYLSGDWGLSDAGSTTFSKGWTKILLGDLPGDQGYPERALLFYNGTSGTAQFYTLVGMGIEIHQVSNTIWAKGWSEILWF